MKFSLTITPLTYILTSAKLDATTQRWIAGLASFQFTINYRSGKSNVDADALSRIKWPESCNEILTNAQLWVKIPKECVLACFQGVKLPFGYIEIIARSAHVLPMPGSKDSGMTESDWRKEQQSDPQLVQLYDLLESGYHLGSKKKQILQKFPLVEPFLKNIKQIQVKDDLLYRKVVSFNQGAIKTCLWQLVLPQQLIVKALTGCHDQVGHLGRDRTLSLLRERFYWPSLYKDAIEHLDSCRKCKLRKSRVPRAELVPIQASRPMELVHLDYLCLEPCKGQVENVLVVTDHFTRYAQAFTTKSQTAKVTAKVLWHNFICHYGFPEKFISDQGRNFESQLIADLCKLAKVKKIRTSPYHPMTNGQCERFNRTLCDMLGTLETEEKADWKAFLHTLTHAYNCTRNSSTGFSPFYLMFGRHPRLPVDVAFGIHRIGEGVTFSTSKYVDWLQRRLAHAYKKAKTFADKESDRQKALFDRKSKDLRLEPGDLCLVRKTAWKSRHKIQNRWEDDDYVIISQPNCDIPVFVVRNTKTDQDKTLHRNLLLPLGYKLHVDIPEEEDEDILIQPLFELVEEKEAQPSPSVRPTPKVAFLDQPEILGETRSSVDSSERDLSDSVIGSGVDFDVSTKLGGTSSGVSSLSPTKSCSPEISQSRNSGVSYEDTSKSSLSLASNSQEGNCSFLHEQDPISNGEPISNGDPSNLLEVYEPSTSMIVDETTSSNGLISDTTASSDDSVEPEGSPIAHKESVDSEEDSSSEEEGDQAPTLRRSSRSTRGAPPKRFGFAFTHQLSVFPRLNIPDFEFNL